MICEHIQRLINYSIKNDLIDKADEIVIRNMLMDAMRVYDWQDSPVREADESIDDILIPLVDFACGEGVIEDTVANRDLFDTKLMGIVTPLPRDIICEFEKRYSSSPESATDWYYDNSKKLNYVRAGRIAKDLKWTYDSDFGTLDITINRSKPEKDPRDIEKARATASTAYPKCQLCAENMGFAGNQNHPARQNLRPIPIEIAGGEWYLQYSPYGYYNEHCIVFNSKHIPMVIDADVFKKLFDFTHRFPHYFVGSNADLPIVGGSILSHEHFQGGRYTFAMAKAEEEYKFVLPEFAGVEAATLKWPMSVIRLRSKDKEELCEACAKILSKWRSYTDENHIKKENIGLIEVMGLAVLPARLATELEDVKTALLNGADLRDDPSTLSHADWAEEILKNHPELDEDNAMDIIKEEVGKVFEEVLCDAGVFKRDQKGQEAFKAFIASLT